MDDGAAFLVKKDLRQLEEDFVAKLHELRKMPAGSGSGGSVPTGIRIMLLQTQESDLTRAQRLAMLGYLTWDLQNGVIGVSESVGTLFGVVSFRNIKSMDVILSYVHPDDRVSFVDDLDNALFHDVPYSSEYRVMDASDQIHRIHSNGEVIKDDNGKPFRMFATLQDVTDRHQASNVSKHEEQSIHDLIFAITDSIEKSVEDPMNAVTESMVLVTPDGTIIAINETAAQRLGGNRDGMIGKNYFNYLSPEVAERRKARFAEVGRWKLPTRGEDLVDGRYYDQTIYPILSAGGEVARFALFSADITEIKRAEQALHDSEEKLRSMITQSKDGVLLIDSAGLILEYNHGYEEITGIPRERMLGKTIWELQYALSTRLHKDEAELRSIRQLYQSWIRNMLELETHNQASMYIRRPDGDVRAVEISSFRVSTNKQSLIGSIIRDVTDQKKAENALRVSLREKEVLLKEIHHRVTNNLQVISSMLSLQMDSGTDANTAYVLRVCQDRIRSIGLVHERLYYEDDMSRIDFGKYVDKLITSLNHYYRDRVENIDLKVDTGEISLGIDTAIPCGLIVNELITNAFKYAFPDGRKGEVAIRLTGDAEGQYQLVIADNGVGLPGGLDIKNTSTMGMSLVNLLVDQLDGTLAVDTQHGTTYTISFSVKQRQSYPKAEK